MLEINGRTLTISNLKRRKPKSSPE